MTATNIIATAALSAILAAFGTASPQAAESSHTLTMKPIEGVSFDIGSKRAVSYFVSQNEHCKLVLTLADPPRFEDIATLTATRFEAAIPAGKSTRFDASEGKSLEFSCQLGAQAMTVTGVERIAAGTHQ